ncbi:TonB-dependent receptor, partial [candidate division KSB1 bacterium]|nr:TonB-dependent receptor [candidate division KSB1 bacterium]
GGIMNRKILVGLLLLLLLPTWLLAGITGKISGFVKDQETGDPLPGVNVIIQETTMGAATDVNGFYVILNVPVGTYTLKAMYIGYKVVDISNIRVQTDLTTEVNFDLPPTVLEGEMVSIVAKRPIINKNVTNTVKTLQAEELQNIPMRGVQTVMNLSSAVVDGDHVRGGRSEENVTYIDGVMTTLLRDGSTNALTVINNAIEESNFHAGGFQAEYGFAAAGVLLTTTKTGGTDYHFSLEGISDELFENNEGKTLGTQTWGYNTYTLTASGPVPGIADNKLRFFLAGERNYNGGFATFWEGLKIDTVMTSFGREQHFNVDYGPGPIPGYFNSTYDLNSNLVYALPTMRIKVGGSYHQGKDRAGNSWNDIANIDKLQLNKRWNASGYLNLTHNLNPRMFYTFRLSYFYEKAEWGDPLLWNDIRNYANPEYNVGSDGETVLRDWGMDYNYNLYGILDLSVPGEVIAGYGKDAQMNFGPKFDLTWQFNNSNELRTGLEYNYYTLRRFRVGAWGISQDLWDRSQDPDDKSTDFDLFRNNMNNFGYDIWGNEINSDKYYDATNNVGVIEQVNGRDAPRHPVRAAYYIQDKIELKDLVLNAGIRFDYFTTGTNRYKDPTRLIIDEFSLIDESSLEDEGKFFEISPRLGWSFPVTDQTVFHAQFGKFVQMPRLNDLYDGFTSGSRHLAGDYFREMPNPNLEPMKTIQYEVGFKQQIGQNASLNLTAFYKDIKDYIQLRVMYPEPGYGYPGQAFYQNVDFGTTKGFTVNFMLRRTNRISAVVDYTYSKAMGTGSSTSSHRDIAWQDDQLRFPTVLMPLDHNQDHNASINIDFRLTKDDGPILFNVKPLANLGVNLLYLMHSGSRYTKIEPGPRGLLPQNGPRPLEALNASQMPWYYRMDLKIDKTFNFSQFRIKPYVWIYNVFNKKNVTDVHLQSGDPHDNGWFLTEDGKAWAAINGTTGVYYAQKAMSDGGRARVSTPRILRFGLFIEY